MPRNKPQSTRRSGQTLIGLLVVVVIAIVLYLMFLGPRRGKDGEMRPSIAKQSINKAEIDVAMTSNISQINQAIMMYKADNGKPPASLDELKSSAYARGFPAEMWINPVTKQPLVYDPQTGQVLSPPAPAAPGAPAGVAPASRPAIPAPGGNIPADLLN